MKEKNFYEVVSAIAQFIEKADQEPVKTESDSQGKNTTMVLLPSGEIRHIPKNAITERMR